MIERLLPGHVEWSEAFGDPGEGDGADESGLFPAEEAVIAKAVASRRREFSTARRCARAALRGLGFGPVELPAGAQGEPLWPSGVTGSITHCAGYRCAVAVWRDDLASIGVDAEPNVRTPPGVLGVVAHPWERRWVAQRLLEQPAVSWDRLLFSAKEAAYKAWFPLTGRFAQFGQAQVELHRDGAFTALITDETAALTFTGAWLGEAGLLLTVALPVDGRPAGLAQVRRQ